MIEVSRWCEGLLTLAKPSIMLSQVPLLRFCTRIGEVARPSWPLAAYSDITTNMKIRAHLKARGSLNTQANRQHGQKEKGCQNLKNNRPHRRAQWPPDVDSPAFTLISNSPPFTHHRASGVGHARSIPFASSLTRYDYILAYSVAHIPYNLYDLWSPGRQSPKEYLLLLFTFDRPRVIY